MATITVTSDLDNFDAFDGATTRSPRPTTAHHRVRPPPFFGSQFTITLQSSLVIDKSITIIGDGYHSSSAVGAPDVLITAGTPGEPGEGGGPGFFNMLYVAAGANVTIKGVALSNTAYVYVPGAHGASGANGGAGQSGAVTGPSVIPTAQMARAAEMPVRAVRARIARLVTPLNGT